MKRTYVLSVVNIQKLSSMSCGIVRLPEMYGAKVTGPFRSCHVPTQVS